MKTISGPSSAATCPTYKLSLDLGLVKVKTLSGPIAAAMTGSGGRALQLGRARGRALRLGQARGPSAAATG